MNIRTALLALASLASLAGGCVYAPLNGSVVNTTSTPIAVNGYAAYGSDTLVLQVQDPTDSSWDTLTTTTSATGNMNGGGSQSLFSYSFGSIVVPAAYWSDGGYDNDCATLRVTESGLPLGTFGATGYPDPDFDPETDGFDPHIHSGYDCINAEFGDNGGDWYQAGAACSTGRTTTVCTPATIPPPR